MRHVLISIIIPAYNAGKWIGDAIRSVQEQTENNWEVIVVNDGSEDDTMLVARAFKDERIQVIDQPNGGVSSARNTGLDRAKGEFIRFLDADDAMLPNDLSLKLEVLKAHTVDWVFGDLVICDRLLKPSGSILAGTDGDVLTSILLGKYPAVPAPCSNVIAHHRCFSKGLRFDKDLSNAADQDFAISLARSYSYKHIPQALTLYRVLPGSMSRNIDLYEKDHLRLMNKAKRTGLLEDHAFRRRCFANAYWAIGGSWWKKGNSPLKGIPWLMKAIIRRPSLLLRPLLAKR